MAEAWAVGGAELPEAFIFPITKLGVTSDIHREGSFANTSLLNREWDRRKRRGIAGGEAVRSYGRPV